MPIYEYRCDACQQSFEKFFRSATGDTSTAACPSCNAAANRLVSAFAHPRGATPGAGDPEHPGPPALGGDDQGHGHSHGFGGHSHDAMHGHSH